jgi:hypothetical protein
MIRDLNDDKTNALAQFFDQRVSHSRIAIESVSSAPENKNNAESAKQASPMAHFASHFVVGFRVLRRIKQQRVCGAGIIRPVWQ